MAGRREVPVDPGAGPVQRFAFELRKLRRGAGGVPYRVMAQRAGYSITTLSQAAAGEQLPTLPVALAYVRACGGDAQEWQARWKQAVEEIAAHVTDDDDADADPPYRGLARFETGDNGRFFGREQLTGDLLDLLRRRRFAAIFGPSGIGKSSLLRAGLIPALQHTHDTGLRPAAIRILTPGDRPARTHGPNLTPTDTRPTTGSDTLVIVDQFEEVFTLCQDAAERARFLDLLLTARQPESRLRVLLAVRADFYGRCAEHRELAEALRDANVLVGPMSPGELREAIVKPAAAEGLTVERALTAHLVEEVADAPGGLPLLSHVLLETWRRRRGKVLTMSGYTAAGGLGGAIAKTAEEAYGRFTEGQKAAARRVLLRLVAPGEGTPDTRRPVQRAELEATTERQDAAQVLEHLARARLLTLDGDTGADLAHEALLTAWPRLHRWIEEDRERLLAHRHLTAATQEWQKLGQDSGALYRGARLATAEEHFVIEQRHGELTVHEAAFLTASLTARDDERRSAARHHRHLRHLAAGLAALLLVATALGVNSFHQQQEAVHARQEAVSRQLAAQALQLADSRPDTAMLLSVQAYHTAPTQEARSALLSMSAHQYYRAELAGHADAVSEVAFSSDGRTIASASKDGTTVLWDTARRQRRATLTSHDTWLRAVEFSPDMALLATAGDDGKVVLWDAARHRRTTTLRGRAGPILDVAFNPGGGALATAGRNGAVQLWDIADRTARRTLTGHDSAVTDVEFAPDGRTLATASEDGTARLWSAQTGEQLAVLRGHTAEVNSIAFSPEDGRTVATASNDHTVRLWDAQEHSPRAVLTGHTGTAKAVRFSPDGRSLASIGYDNTVRLWDPERNTEKATLTGHTSNPYGLAFHPRGTLLASGDEDGKIILWDPTRIPLSGHTDHVNDIAFSPDGQTVATASDDRTAIAWSSRRHARKATLRGDATMNAVTFSPDGRTIAAASGSPKQPRADDSALTLWNPASGAPPARLTGHTDLLWDTAFSPDGHTIMTTARDGKLMFWDAQRRTRLATIDAGNVRSANSVAISPDGRLFATSFHDGTAALWDMAERTRIATLNGHTEPLRDLAFSADGRTLATAGLDQKVILWNVAERTPSATLVGNTGPVNSLAFSPDGRMLATASADSAVVLWDLDRQTAMATLTGHDRQVSALAFSPDGRRLATASEDHTAMLWSTDPRRMVEQLCATLGRDLTRDEWDRFVPGRDYRRTCDAG